MDKPLEKPFQQKTDLLFEPIRIGHLTVKNRLCMSAMNENMCTADGAPTDHQIAYFEARAKGGVA